MDALAGLNCQICQRQPQRTRRASGKAQDELTALDNICCRLLDVHLMLPFRTAFETKGMAWVTAVEILRRVSLGSLGTGFF